LNKTLNGLLSLLST